MKIRDTDPSNALPRWFLAGTGAACIACVALFTLAMALDSIALGFGAILVLLIAATVLPIALRRHQQRQQEPAAPD